MFCMGSVEYLCLLASLHILDEHLARPEPREFIKCLSSLVVLDDASYSIVCSAKVAFRFELHVSHIAVLGTSYIRMVSKLILHLAKKNAPGVHVRLR